MRRLLGLAVVLALFTGTLAVADDPPKSPAEELKQLQKGVADAQKKATELRQKASKTEDADEKEKLNKEFRDASAETSKLMQTNQARAIEIAKADPKSETGLDAALWGMMSLRTKPEELQDLVGQIVEHHAASKKIGGVLAPLNMLAAATPRANASEEEVAKVRERSAKALEMVEMIAAKSPEKAVKAQAFFAIGDFYKNKSEPRGRKAPADADELAKKAEAAFERVQKEFGDVVQFRDRKYGDVAKTALFELRNLRVGKTVPEVTGEDTDGATFKLSDYRGKVVMLDFWGHW